MHKSSIPEIAKKNKIEKWWSLFLDTFDDLHREERGYLCVSRQLVLQMKHLGAPKTPRTGVAGISRVDEQDWKARQIGGKTNKDSDGVLFVPNVGSSYCLGTCEKIALQVQINQCDFPIKFIASYAEIDEQEKRFESVNWITLRRSFHVLDHHSIATSVIMSRRYVKRFAQVPELVSAAREVFGKFWRLKIGGLAFQHFLQVEIAVRWLKKNPVSVVVTMNDLVRPGACFITAAKKLGISTIVIQHGVYGPLNVPFEADECWVWGPQTREFLQERGALPCRIQEAGNFEIEYLETEMQEPEVNDEILLMLQWGGVEIWGDPIFRDIVAATATAMMEVDPQWKLRLRAHPTDGEDAKEKVMVILEDLGIDYSFSQPDCSVLEDVSRSAAVLAVNSSALAHAIALGIPCLQYLPERLEKRLGTRFVGEENVAQCPEHLISWLRLLHSGKLTVRESPSDIFSNFGKTLEFASERILTIRRQNKI